MGTPERGPHDPLSRLEALLARARSVGFFELVRLVEGMLPGGAAVGGEGPAREERVRFRHDPSLGFPSGDVVSARLVAGGPDGETPHVEIVTAFLGLTGAASPLPLHIAEEVLHEDPDTGRLRAFLDIFHHRLLGLLHRGVRRYEVAASATAEDMVLAAAGIDVRSQPRLGLDRAELLRVAPVLVAGRGSAFAIEAAVEVLFEARFDGARATVEPFVGGVADFDESQRTRLGVHRSRLGESVVLGGRVLTPAGRFLLRVGPLDAETYEALLPGGTLGSKLAAVVELAAGEPVDFDVELTLRDDARPAFRLRASHGAALGRATFLSVSGGHSRVRVGAHKLRGATGAAHVER